MNNLVSFKTISWDVPEEVYRKDPAYSYSTLAKFHREGFAGLATLFDHISTPSLIFGSVVDTLITGTKEEFRDRFLVADVDPLSDSLSTVVNALYAKYGEKFDTLAEMPDSFIAETAKDCNYYAADKWVNLRVKKVREECSDMYEMMHKAKDKTVIDSAVYNDAIACVARLKNSDMTRAYFSDKPVEGLERLYQLKFKGTWNGYNLRCMADLIVVDHKRKKIIPCDLKTSSHNEWDFADSFKTWCYWIQAELYWYLIRQNMDKSPIFKDYTLEDYRFIVVNRNNRKPMVWQFEDTKNSDTRKIGYIELKSWKEIVPELDSYLKEKPEYPHGTKKINSITDALYGNKN